MLIIMSLSANYFLQHFLFLLFPPIKNMYYFNYLDTISKKKKKKAWCQFLD